MKKQFQIGDILSFKEQPYQRVTRQFNEFLPKANSFIKECETLIRRRLTTEEFISCIVTSTGMTLIKAECTKVVKGEVTGILADMIGDSVQTSINKVIADLDQKRVVLANTYNQYNGTMFDSINIHEIILKDGLATYDDVKIKTRYTTKIKNDQDLAIVEQATNIKALWDELNQQAKNMGWQGYMLDNSGNGLFAENEDGTLFINFDSIGILKTGEQRKKAVA